MDQCDFLPVSAEEMHERGWWWYDALVVGGDAYVDHPSFGTAVISRVLEAEGLRVAVLAQPDWHDAEAFRAMGRPRLGVFIGAGNLDSMVAHYTAAKRRRSEDFYSPGKRTGCRPDRAAIVYCNRAREAFGPDVPIILGSLEASLRRFAHYDYWDDSVRRAILFDAPADLLVYGMGEAATIEIAHRLKKKQSVHTMTDIPGTGYITRDPSVCKFDHITLPSYEDVRDDKRLYAEATRTEYAEHDPVRGRAMIQPCEGRYLVINPPAMPLDTKELDRVADLPYTREWHPMYEPLGGVPAIEEVRFSVIHNRGCFGGCNFCALAFHQGRMITSRSHASVIREVEAMTRHPLWKGYVSDVGGPSANFRHPSCRQQLERGMCPNRLCLAPTPCPNIDADHSDYLALLRNVREVSASSANVLITGESGTGKELVARAIHAASGRRDKPFISFNCATIPETLIESELFGYYGGAFTGANKKGKKGYFELAHGGTIFLDEVNELSRSAQTKILKFLEDRTFIPIGSEESVSVDVRVICATNGRLRQLMEQGAFRKDLYYRLSVFEFVIPPLRERPEDIAPIAMKFVAEFNRMHQHNFRLTPALIRRLRDHDYPGNVRQLRNVIERLVVISKLGMSPDFAFRVPEQQARPCRQEEKAMPTELRLVEQQHIARVLELAGHNKDKAARMLGISKSTLWRKCHEMRPGAEDPA